MPDDSSPHKTLDDRVSSLEERERGAIADRTSIGLLLKVAAAVITLSSAGVVGGAISVYSKSITTEQRVSVLEGRAASLETAAQRRESEDRTQRDQNADMRSDVRAIRVQLDDLARRLQRAEDDRVPAAPHR